MFEKLSTFRPGRVDRSFDLCDTVCSNLNPRPKGNLMNISEILNQAIDAHVNDDEDGMPTVSEYSEAIYPGGPTVDAAKSSTDRDGFLREIDKRVKHIRSVDDEVVEVSITRENLAALMDMLTNA